MAFSERYRRQLRLVHNADPKWGTSGLKQIGRVEAVMQANGYQTILDYGCGKGALVQELRKRGWTATGYDPGVDQWAAIPLHPSDLLVCYDVLEHFEPEYLDAALKQMARLTGKWGDLIISSRPAVQVLPDGRNAHLIQEGADFWRAALSKHFRVERCYERGDAPGRVYASVQPKR